MYINTNANNSGIGVWTHRDAPACSRQILDGKRGWQ